jgi:hypothetical protein
MPQSFSKGIKIKRNAKFAIDAFKARGQNRECSKPTAKTL